MVTIRPEFGHFHEVPFGVSFALTFDRQFNRDVGHMLTPAEQLFLEQINRARLDPEAEAARFGIGLNDPTPPDSGDEPADDGPEETLTGEARQPLAHNALLSEASENHSDDMVEREYFDHVSPDDSYPQDRADDVGYEGGVGENLAQMASTGDLSLEEAVTTGLPHPSDPKPPHHEGLFLSAGHRVNMLNEQYREFGVAQVADTRTNKDGVEYNYSIITNKFGIPADDKVFLTGVVFNNGDYEPFYSIGSGRGAFDIAAGDASTTTWAAGGYSLAVDSDPAVTVTLGQGANATTVTVDLSGSNVKLDLLNGERLLTSGDVVLGSGALDVQMLGTADNSVTGNGEGNFFYVGRGDNTLFGGGGIDTAVFSGLHADYEVETAADGRVTVTDKRDGVDSDGVNELTGVSRLQFSDDETVDLYDPVQLSVSLMDLGGAEVADAGLRFTVSDNVFFDAQSVVDGPFVLDLPAETAGRLDIVGEAGTGASLDVQDALNVLRLAVGLEPSFGPETPHDLIAADVNRDGEVNVDDALNVLRAAVDLPATGAGQHVMLDPDQSLDHITDDNVSYDTGLDLGGFSEDSGLDVQVVLLGDVGASHAV